MRSSRRVTRRRLGPWRIVAAVCSVTMLLGVPNATATAVRRTQLPIGTTTGMTVPSRDPSAYLPASSRGVVRMLESTVEGLRSELTKDSYAARVQATLQAGGPRTVNLPPLPTPRAQHLRAVAGLQSRLAAPVAGLYAAVKTAADAMGRLPAADVDYYLSTLARSQQSAPSRQAKAPFILTAPPAPDVGLGPNPTVGIQTPVTIKGETTPALDRAAKEGAGAALIVAEALDRYLDDIRQAGATVPSRAGSAVVGCDVLDQTPFLCVGSDADNTYGTDQMLLIDLGGNDTYTNSAGGAPFLPDQGAALIPLSVNVDQSGNDTYATQALERVDLPRLYPFGAPAHYRYILGEGASFAGAVGILVDQAGSDSYIARLGSSLTCTAQESAPFCFTAVFAQGAARDGGGFLFDSGGDNTFDVQGPVLDGQSQTLDSDIIVQGSTYSFTLVDQVGAGLFATGHGNDIYRAIGYDRGAAVPAYRSTLTHLRAQASGSGHAPAVLYDDGGNDTFEIRNRLRNEGAATTFSVNTPSPTVMAGGQGSGAQQRGFLLEGPGDTNYITDLVSEGFAKTYVWGAQGSGFGFDGIGILDDEAGNDSYVARSATTSEATITVTDACRTTRGLPCEVASAVFDAGLCNDAKTACTLSSELMAQGGNGAGGIALLDDHEGNDRYTAETLERLDVTLRDELTQPIAPPRLDAYAYEPPLFFAQGGGQGNTGAAAGLLIDRDGDDRYVARSNNATSAAASSQNADSEPVVHAAATTTLARGFAAAQGAAYQSANDVNALLDLGGKEDFFTASAMSPVTTYPNPDGAQEWGSFWPFFQGAQPEGGSAPSHPGVFVALADHPHIASAPARPVCVDSPGPRGSSFWMDCRAWSDDAAHLPIDRPSTGDVGYGYAPNATGTQPSLSFLGSATAAETGSVQAVQLRLVDAGGEPLQGASVRVGLQLHVCGLVLTAVPACSDWRNVSERDATTDANGVATLRLPVPTGLDAAQEFHLFGSFDGQAAQDTLFPAYAQQPIDVRAP